MEAMAGSRKRRSGSLIVIAIIFIGIKWIPSKAPRWRRLNQLSIINLSTFFPQLIFEGMKNQNFGTDSILFSLLLFEGSKISWRGI